MQVAKEIASGKPLAIVIRGVLASHYSFKTQSKSKTEAHNKNRLPNMKWWNEFLGSVDKIPLRVKKAKPTMRKKKQWVENSTAKSLAMVYDSLEQVYGTELAEHYLKELVQLGKEKISEYDKSMIEQRVIELLNGEEY